MPEVEIEIGGRRYEVACQAGEEHYLTTAAEMLDVEASALLEQTGRLPELRVLLMSGLMLADKAAACEEQLAQAQKQISSLEAGGAIAPSDLTKLSDLTARAEDIAKQADAAK